MKLMKIDVKKTFKLMKLGFNSNSHIIAGGVGVIGLGVTTGVTYAHSPKIHEILDKRKKKIREFQKSDMSDEELKAAIEEANKECGKELIPEVTPIGVSFVLTAGAMVGSVLFANAKIRDLTSIANFAELSRQELLKQIRANEEAEKAEKIISEAEKETQKTVVEDTVKQAGGSTYSPVIPQTKGGHTLFMCALDGRLFYCDNDTIMRAATKLNHQMSTEVGPFVDSSLKSLGDLYDEIGLSDEHILARKFCWSDQYPIDPNLNGSIRLDNGDFVAILDFYDRPLYIKKLDKD